MELRGVVLLLFPPASFDSSWLLVGGNGLLVAWLALLRSIGPRPAPTPGGQNMQGEERRNNR